MTDSTIVPVELGARRYDIYVGAGLLAEAGRHIRPFLKRPQLVIVSEETVAAHYLKPLTASLAEAGISARAIILPAGEGSKSFPTLERLLSELLDAEVERNDKVIALGGGVIGDLVGFAASILRRGVDFIQIPTTLLSQVDSSVGGKTGINVRQGKNLIGSFHQPRLVLADTGTLSTLSPRDRRAGFAEVIKYGLLGDAAFFDWLETNGSSVLAGDAAALNHAVVTSCHAKAAIVIEDERETGRRALLNLGHTFGHALEAETGYSDRLLHGEGVALGMALAFDLSVALGHCPEADAARARALIARSGLPVRIADLDGRFNADALIAHMKQDKKVEAGTMTFVLAHAIGDSFLSREVPEQVLKSVLEASIG
ncbi:3-dehydroquinate synthase [Govanella unica]|uniref:3-dehydroquinate synthase n=1 Tax=Govanella unica TaxID=2975056 RepID=A0A9X3TVV0_9PROT|nr:3-dehydroquinate synthase [Govania unica]MDA5192367.1 3-dehydroquinate synthase [Govania unica]